VLPDFRTGFLYGSETYGITFPTSIFDNDTLPTATSTGTFSATAVAGATFSGTATGVVVGIDLANPATATWPSLSGASAVDHDADGKPGITALSKTGNPYNLIWLEALRTARATELYMAVRQVRTFAGTLTTCTQQSGAATISRQDSLVFGCLRSGGGDCSTTQRDFLDDNRPTYNVPVNGTYTMVKVADGATCATVRSTLP
jgi:hypothetical protein